MIGAGVDVLEYGYASTATFWLVVVAGVAHAERDVVDALMTAHFLVS
jgi:hypothetical protein